MQALFELLHGLAGVVIMFWLYYKLFTWLAGLIFKEKD